MSFNPKYSALAVNTKADAQAALLNGGFLDLYDGTQPATADTAVSTQRKLARLTFGNPAFGPAVGGVVTANPITSDLDAAATGTAAWSRLVTAGEAVVTDGSVGTAGCNVNLTRTAIEQHGSVSVSNLSLTEKMN